MSTVPTPSPFRPGFTLIDLMVALTIMVVAALIVLPGLSDDSRLRVMAAARVVTSDIEMAQVMTISNPAKPVVVRFEPGAAKYWLAFSTTPTDPIKRPGTDDDYEVILGQGRARSAADVSMFLTDMDFNTVTFDVHGGLTDITASPQIRLSAGSRWIKLSIAPTTGSITETADND